MILAGIALDRQNALQFPGMRIVLQGLFVVLLAGVAIGLSGGTSAQSPERIDFARDIQPLLRTNCYGCHSASLQSGNFRLDRRRDSMPNRVGANNARIVPGDSAASRLYRRVAGGEAGLQMPPTGALRPQEINTIKTWIDQGAEWPDELAGETPSPPENPLATQVLDALRLGDRRKVEQLLKRNPKVAHATGSGGITPLMYAALYGDTPSARLLLEMGVDPNARNDAGATALLWAVDDPETTRLLLERGADPNVRSADGRTPLLVAAARFGAGEVVKALLDRGATLDGQAVLSQAADAGDATVMRLLIDRGADKGTLPVAAPRRAETREVTRPALTLKKPAAPRSVRDAVSVSLPLLQRADEVFLKTAGCVSCHNNSLFQMTAAVVRRKGFRIDEAIVREQMTRTRAYLESWRERELQDIPIPGRIDTTAYILAGLAAARYPSDPATDALARYVKRRQLAEGGWRVAANRPPIESSDFAVTALALRSLQAYAPAPRKAEYARAIQRGAAWLAQARPQSTEDHAFLLLGLGWAGASKTGIRKGASELIALQRTDGGWGQTPTMGSDAYATGQALTALVESGAVKPGDPIYEKGVRFLLGTQLEDGSWYVGSRANPVQPYFDSEFPHGQDQFISAAATNWATMALAHAVR